MWWPATTAEHLEAAADALYDQLGAVTVRLVERHCAIEAVAAALLRSKVLNQDRIDIMIAETSVRHHQTSAGWFSTVYT